MAQSDQYQPLPRQKGTARLYRAPDGQTVSEHFVRTLRSKERGFTSPRAETKAKRSEQFQVIVEEAAKHSGLSKKHVASDTMLNREFAQAFVKPDGTIRTWAEAEAHDPSAVGQLLVDTGHLTQAQAYRYYASRGGLSD